MFAHRLALAAGNLDVDDMLEALDVRQFQRWAAYYAVDPWGEERADLRAGIVAATTANASGRYRRTMRPTDFMPMRERPRQTAAEQWAVILAAAGRARDGV